MLIDFGFASNFVHNFAHFPCFFAVLLIKKNMLTFYALFVLIVYA